MKGAALGCMIKECPHSFHYGCARALKYISFDEQKWQILCPDCRTDLPEDLSRDEKFGSVLQKSNSESDATDKSASQFQVGTRVSAREGSSWNDAVIIAVSTNSTDGELTCSVRFLSAAREMHGVGINDMKLLAPSDSVSGPGTPDLPASPAAENDIDASKYRTRSSKKKRKRSIARELCMLCGASSVAGRVGLKDAPMLTFSNGAKKISVHVECLEWTPEIYYDEERNCWENVWSALDRVSKLKCSHRGCGLTGAALGCSVENCPHTFHYRCARDLEFCEFDEQRWQITCPKCVPRGNLPRSGRGILRDSLFGESEDADGSDFTDDESSDEQEEEAEDKLHDDDDGVVLDLPKTVKPESDPLFTGALLEHAASVFVFAQTFQSILGIRPFTFLKFRNELLKPYEGSLITDLFFSLLNILLSERDRHLLLDAEEGTGMNQPQWMINLPSNKCEPLQEGVHWPLPSQQAKTFTGAKCHGLHKASRLREYRAKHGEKPCDIAKAMEVSLDVILAINSRYRGLTAQSPLIRGTLILLPLREISNSSEESDDQGTSQDLEQKFSDALVRCYVLCQCA